MSRIDEALRGAVERGEVAGIAAAAATRDGTFYEGAFGHRNLADRTPMGVDSLLRIASMTKAITSAAALQLVERGELDLDADVGEVLPELGAPRVLEGFAPATGEPILRPAAGPITARQLLTHTSGLTYDLWSPAIVEYGQKAGVPSIGEGGDGFLDVPLVADPGTRWAYSISTDRLGQIVERVSGRSLDAYFREHLLDPLGMSDTHFNVPEEKLQRLATVYARGEDGSLIALPMTAPTNVKFFGGGGGLVSTAPDYLRFLRALLAGGELDGARILRPETVELMAQNQIGDLEVEPLRTANAAMSNDVDFFPGKTKKWSLGFLLNTEPVEGGRVANSLAWAGIFNSYYWIDRESGLCAALFTQTLPFFDARVLALLEAFERAVYAELG